MQELSIKPQHLMDLANKRMLLYIPRFEIQCQPKKIMSMKLCLLCGGSLKSSSQEQWMGSATLWLVFITLVITEKRVIPLIMKSDSIYSSAYLSFCTHSAQCVTFWSELIIPAVIYIQCVYSCISQIIVINLTNS